MVCPGQADSFDLKFDRKSREISRFTVQYGLEDKTKCTISLTAECKETSLFAHFRLTVAGSLNWWLGLLYRLYRKPSWLMSWTGQHDWPWKKIAATLSCQPQELPSIRFYRKGSVQRVHFMTAIPTGLSNYLSRIKSRVNQDAPLPVHSMAERPEGWQGFVYKVGSLCLSWWVTQATSLVMTLYPAGQCLVSKNVYTSCWLVDAMKKNMAGSFSF